MSPTQIPFVPSTKMAELTRFLWYKIWNDSLLITLFRKAKWCSTNRLTIQKWYIMASLVRDMWIASHVCHKSVTWHKELSIFAIFIYSTHNENPIGSQGPLRMMTSSNGNICCVTGHLCREFTCPPVNSPHKGQWRGALMFSFICVCINGWVNNRKAGDLRRYRAHYDVTVMGGGNQYVR